MSTTDVEALQLRIEASATKLEKDMAKVRLVVDNSLRTIEGRAERASRGFNVIGSRAGAVGQQVTAGMTKASRSLNTLQGQTGNIAAQFQDIAVQLQGGASPFTVALQQGTQLGAILSGAGGTGAAIRGIGAAFASVLSPINLATIGLIAAGGAAVKYFANRDGVSDLSVALKQQPEIIRAIKEAWGEAAKGVADYSAESRSVVAAAVAEQARTLKTGIRSAAEEAVGSVDEVFSKSDAISSVAAATQSLIPGPIAGGPAGLQELKRAADDLTASIKQGTPDILTFRDRLAEIATAADTSDKVRDLANELLTSTKTAGDAARALTSLSDAEARVSERTRIMVSETKRFDDLLSKGLYNEAAQHAQTLGQALLAAAAGQKALNEEQARFAAERLSDKGASYEALNDYYQRRSTGLSTGTVYTPSQISASTPLPSGYVDKVIAAESGGNPYAKSKTSSAMGLGQFTADTWSGLFKTLYPELASTMTEAAISALRTNPDYAKPMLEALSKQNAASLASSGINPTDANLYLAHFLGAGGAKKVLQASPSTPIGDVVSPKAIAANPSVFKSVSTAGDLTAWAGAKMAGASKNDYTAELQQLREKTAALDAQTTAYGRSTEEITRNKAAQDLKLAAEREGIELTPEVLAEIDQVSSAYARQQAAVEAVARKTQEAQAQQQYFAETATDALSDLAFEGESFGDVMENVAKSLGKAALQGALLGTGPLANILGLSSTGGKTGGLFGALFGSLFAEGGYTGPGGKYEPAGVVHKGEYVFDAAATRKLGVANLEALRSRSRGGFANGGYVGSAPLSAHLPSVSGLTSRGSSNVVNFSPVIDARGADAAAVAQLNAKLDTMAKGLPQQIAAVNRLMSVRGVRA